MALIGMIWDFDGVLVFTPHEKAWKRTAESYGATGFDHDFYVTYVSGKPRYEGADNILGLLGLYEKFNATDSEKRQKLLTEFAEAKNKLLQKLIEEGEYQVNWDAVEFLIESKEHGIKHALASASKNATKLARNIKVPYKNNLVSLESLFDINVSGKATTKRGVFQLAIRELNYTFPGITRLIVVEDAPAGIVAAKELGLLTMGYEHETRLEEADLSFKNFREIRVQDILQLVEERG